MKTPFLVAALSATLALPATAQTTGQMMAQTTGPAPTSGAAATLPNAFGEPASAPPRRMASAPAPAAEAPDIARSEQALRAAIAAFQSGQVDYSAFSPSLATQFRAEGAEIAPRVQAYGALKSIEFKGQQDGADLFRVIFANQATDWVIAFDDDDLIYALLFRPARD